MTILSSDPVGLLTGVIGALSAAFAAYKVFDELVNGKYARMKQDIDYYDKLISACKNKEHPLRIEKLFECLYGKQARAEIICMFVNTWPSPTNAIGKFLSARDLLEYTDRSFVFEGQLRRPSYRRILKVANLIVYIFCFVLAWLPLILQPNFSKFTVSNYLALASYCFGMLIMSLASLRYYWKLNIAEKLVNESQRMHRPTPEVQEVEHD